MGARINPFEVRRLHHHRVSQCHQYRESAQPPPPSFSIVQRRIEVSVSALAPAAWSRWKLVNFAGRSVRLMVVKSYCRKGVFAGGRLGTVAAVGRKLNGGEVSTLR